MNAKDFLLILNIGKWWISLWLINHSINQSKILNRPITDYESIIVFSCTELTHYTFDWSIIVSVHTENFKLGTLLIDQSEKSLSSSSIIEFVLMIHGNLDHWLINHGCVVQRTLKDYENLTNLKIFQTLHFILYTNIKFYTPTSFQLNF